MSTILIIRLHETWLDVKGSRELPINAWSYSHVSAMTVSTAWLRDRYGRVGLVVSCTSSQWVVHTRWSKELAYEVIYHWENIYEWMYDIFTSDSGILDDGHGYNMRSRWTRRHRGLTVYVNGKGRMCGFRSCVVTIRRSIGLGVVIIVET